MLNYIVDQNRFNLAGPPKWWLVGLWDFDNSLVVVPSRQGFYYRLAQRRKLNLANHIVNDALFAESDTKMLAKYSLVPVTTILATAQWNPVMFEALSQRAPWRMGGAEKAIKAVEDQDWQDEVNRRVKTDEHLTYLGKDAWKLYNKKIGVRSHMWSPTVKDNQPASAAPAIRTESKTSNNAQVGSIFLP